MGMSIVGTHFKNGEMFVPEVMMSARVMNLGIQIVRPLIAENEIPLSGTVVIGTLGLEGAGNQ